MNDNSGIQFAKAFLFLALLVFWMHPFNGQSVVIAQLVDVKVSMLDGAQHEGTITLIEADGKIVGDRLPMGLVLSEVVRLDVVGRSRPTNVTDQTMVLLVNGSQLVVKGMVLEGETLQFESEIGLNSLPLQSVKAFVWKDSDLVRQQIERPLASEDRVIVESNEGERMVQGLVEGLNAQHLSMQYQNETRKIGVNRINAVLMADIGSKPLNGPLATVELFDGSVVRGVIEDLKADRLNVLISEGVLLSLTADRVVSISIVSDRQRYLSDVEPIDFQQKTQFTVQRSWRRDLSIEGNRLKLRVGKPLELQEFNKGLGTQAFTQLDFSNDNEFTKFKATVGIDAETNGKGDCQMTVRGDGIELWSARVKGDEPAQEIDLDVKGIKVISLVVYQGEAFDLADHADWCNARLVK